MLTTARTKNLLTSIAFNVDDCQKKKRPVATPERADTVLFLQH
jgi:hypothetical protein